MTKLVEIKSRLCGLYFNFRFLDNNRGREGIITHPHFGVNMLSSEGCYCVKKLLTSYEGLQVTILSPLPPPSSLPLEAVIACGGLDWGWPISGRHNIDARHVVGQVDHGATLSYLFGVLLLLI